MKTRKKSIIFLAATILLIAISTTVIAETESDAQGDVWHFEYPYWQSQTVSDQPNIDIKEIKAEVSGDEIRLSMTLWPGGSFSCSQYEYAGYQMYYNTSDAYYVMSYFDIAGVDPISSAIGISIDGKNNHSNAEVTVNGNTINTTLDQVGEDTTKVEFYGTAWMYENYPPRISHDGQSLSDSWHDWVGDYSWNPNIDSDDDDDDEIIPPPQDNQIPTVTIFYPEDGENVSNIFTIRGNASDADGNIQLVQLKINEGSWKIASGTTNWSLSWDTTNVYDGNHTIYVRSYDGQNYSDLDSVEITVYNEEDDVIPDNGDSEINNGTPGFGIIPVLIAIILVLFCKRRTQV